MFDAGLMRDRITVQQYNKAVDAHGDVRDDLDENWESVCTVYAQISPISGREFYAAEQSRSEVSHKIRCRWFPGLKTEQRLVYRGRIFEIVSVIDWNNRHESYLILVKELVE